MEKQEQQLLYSQRSADGRRISYAQNGEDIVLLRALGDQRDGFWIDVGANHPVRDSVTHNFSMMGWNGINLDPVPHFHELLCQFRPNDINLSLALSDEEGELIFYINETNLDLSTFSDELKFRYLDRGDAIRESRVQVVCLSSVCEQYLNGRRIDFLKIDTEGHELHVLKGHDFERFPPRILVAEASQDRLNELTIYAESNNMVFICFDGLNAWYVHNTEAANLGHLVKYPPSPVLDWYHPWVYLDRIQTLEADLVAQQTDCDGQGQKGYGGTTAEGTSSTLAGEHIVDNEIRSLQAQIRALQNSNSYVLGRCLTWPIRVARIIFRRLLKHKGC